jgi:transcription initiation factor IIE alpha subunit
LLHQIDNAQNKIFKDALIKKKNKIKKRSLNLSERLDKDREISDTEKAIFYSSWHHSCIWVYISLEGGKTRDEIHIRTGIDKTQINKVLSFLKEINICHEVDGKYFQKEGRMHLDKNSPHLKQHHINWRIKAIQKLDHPSEEDLNFTAPLSLSKKDFEKIRERLVSFIQELSSTVEKTTPEEIYLVNLDCIKI